MARGLGVRELSRRLLVSASTVSQIEHGNVMPSVNVLYRFASELDISLDDLFAEEGRAPGSASSAPREGDEQRVGPVVRARDRAVLRLATGVRWERLSTAADRDHNVEWIYSVYDVGGESCTADALVRHGGQEYGYVQSGRLRVTLGFEEYDLEPGDSISFESWVPHRFATIGDEPAVVLWCVIGRYGDLRGG
ncbi:MAG: transcriptional regulator, family [Solirubrobacterales bacterium]|nr:transcriptional regulator, family [Solirubrobacterales bacterium]